MCIFVGPKPGPGPGRTRAGTRARWDPGRDPGQRDPGQWDLEPVIEGNGSTKVFGGSQDMHNMSRRFTKKQNTQTKTASFHCASLGPRNTQKEKQHSRKQTRSTFGVTVDLFAFSCMYSIVLVNMKFPANLFT